MSQIPSTPIPGWPAVTFEPRPWKQDAGVATSRRQKLLARGDYQAAVPPFIANLEVHLDAEALTTADDASAELARFDSELGSVTAPFASILLRSESASSSEVEQLTSSAKQVALAELGAAKSENAHLVVANVRAMQAALQLSENINERAIISMQHALLHESAPEHTGQFRNTQVWIGGGGISPHSAEFVPPHHDRVPELMTDLVQFSRRTDIPLLAHAALMHAQFETIHPFPDGNGRTGRALLHSMLRHGGLTRNVTVPVSAGLLSNTAEYFTALSKYRDGDTGAIVVTFADAVFAGINNGRQLVTELEAVAAEWEKIAPTRQGSAVTALKTLLLRQPVVTVALVATELGVSSVTATNAIERLVSSEVLVQTNSFKRNRMWHAPEVLTALDRFGSRARRRLP
ncbi:Fic family protein [Leucobacter chinensis]|uniref:Fic family protein n=1 Tax=Leucobacter chinensis TaxID=2851010 RepID=UPI001C21F6AC|nr:Fic family protein [Leucobacter chinensis]